MDSSGRPASDRDVISELNLSYNEDTLYITRYASCTSSSNLYMQYRYNSPSRAKPSSSGGISTYN